MFESPSPAPDSELRIPHWSDRRILLLLALGTLVVSIVWNAPQWLHFLGARAGELIVTLVIAMSFTYLLRPAVLAINRTRAFGGGTSRPGRMWATVLVFGLGLLLIWLFVLVGLKPIAGNIREMWGSFMPRDPQESAAKIAEWKASLKLALAPYNSVLPFEVDDIDQSIPLWIRSAAGWVATKVSHSVSPGFIVELILVPVLVFYFLTDGPAIRGEARLLSPPAWRPHGGKMLSHLDRVLDGYIRGQVWMCLIAWVLVTLGLLLLGVRYPFTLGLVAGVTRAVPVIGPLLGGIPIILICLISTKSIETTSLLLVGFTLMHFLESKVLLPKIVGHEVDLHPVSVIVSLLIGMEFFGFLGVFLAVPIAAVLKIVLTEWHISQLERKSVLPGAVTATPAPDSATSRAHQSTLVGATGHGAATTPTAALTPTSKQR